MVDVVGCPEHQLHQPFQHDRVACLPVMNVALGGVRIVVADHLEPAECLLIGGLEDLPRMLGLAHVMVTDAIGAYVRRDSSAAREIIQRDDQVDELYWQLFRELLSFMIEDSESISRSIDLILIARFIERIADQATNICEEVVYLVEAEPIRHQREDHEDHGDPTEPAE